MRFVEATDMPRFKKRTGKLQQIIEDFVNSEYDVVKIEYAENEYANPHSCKNSLWKAIKQTKSSGVRAHEIKGIVYLTKEKK